MEVFAFWVKWVKIAEDYGGVVEKNTGDGLMAYFNDGEGTPPEGGCSRVIPDTQINMGEENPQCRQVAHTVWCG